MPREAYKDRHQRLGKHYGYPQCCINEFIEDAKVLATGTKKQRPSSEVRSVAQQQIWAKGTGFIPCRRHANMITKGLITQESLITGRSKTIQQFPDERPATKVVTTALCETVCIEED